MYIKMVLLSNDNQLNIKKTHMLKCLEKRRNTFKVLVVPLQETVIINHNKNMNIVMDNPCINTNNHINTLLDSK